MKRFMILLAVGLFLTVSVAHAQSSGNYTLDGDSIILSNNAYEVTLSAEHGGITSVVDKATGETISSGSVGGNLWRVQFDNNQSLNSSAYTGKFTSAWDDSTGTLTLTYTDAITVEVTITSDETAALRLSASLTNNSGSIISDFTFPAGLQVVESEITDGLLPLLPGAQIGSKFFTDGRTFINIYPGVLFADYLALRSSAGKLTVYGQKGDVLQPALLGYEHLADVPDTTAIRHTYKTWIADGSTWQAPNVVINVGEDYPQTIAAYRADNGIDAYPALTDKLGEAASTYFAAPMYKLDLVVLKKTFAELKAEVIDKLTFPGIIHFVAFQLGGHDKNYPLFIPAAPKWGTNEDFADLVSYLHDEGSVAVPYTNFSWWDNDGPILLKLAEGVKLTDVINIKDSHGLPGFESYGPNSGFVMNLHNDFVRNIITEQHNLLRDTIGMDGIFEDQFGARSAPYDFNPAGLDQFDPSTSYFGGVLQHYRDHAADNLFVEVGVDVLAEHGIGFMGTNYLWDMLGYRSATADVTTYYPMAAMLLRDKVLLYQHNLAAETWTNGKDMLRWNLAQGYNLSNAFLDSNVGGLNMNNTWIKLVGAFQSYALANYADELVTAYDTLGENVTRTTFGSYTVFANWDAEQTYEGDGYTLAAGGVVTQAIDGSVTAGVFTAYNGAALKGNDDHYLIETRSPEGIRVLQPIGEDTDLSVRANSDWSAVTVTAYAYDGTELGTVDSTLEGNLITFKYSNRVDRKQVGYYEITGG